MSERSTLSHPISAIDFLAHSGQPITIDVTKDGKEYEITVGIVIMSVDDTGEVENGLPKFDVHANMVLDVQEKSK